MSALDLCVHGLRNGRTGPATDEENPPTLDYPDPKDLVLTDYSVATLADLKPFTPAVSGNESIDGWPTNSLKRDMWAASSGLYIISEAFNNEITSFTPITSRSVSAGLQLQIENEGFKVESKNEENETFESTILIDYLDIFLEGEVNSLSSLLAKTFDINTVITALTMDGRIQISGKMRNITDNYFFETATSEDLSGVVSLFVDLSIEGSDLQTDTPTGLLSGRVSFSAGSNLVVEFGDSAESPDTLYHTPVVLQMELAPFTDVDLVVLIAAIEDESKETEPDYWSVIHPIMWPSKTGDLFTITRIIGNYDATSVRDTRTWTNAAAFNLIYSMYESDEVD